MEHIDDPGADPPLPKVEKDSAMDRADVCEQTSKDAKIRAAKAEEEVEELVKKAQQLEVKLLSTIYNNLGQIVSLSV